MIDESWTTKVGRVIRRLIVAASVVCLTVWSALVIYVAIALLNDSHQHDAPSTILSGAVVLVGIPLTVYRLTIRRIART